MGYTPTSTSTALLAELLIARNSENGFVLSERETVSNNGGALNVRLGNPSDADVDLIVHDIKISTQFEGSVDVFDTYTTAPNSGTDISVDNLLMDTSQSNGTTRATAEKGVSFDSDNPHFQGTIPSGGVGGKSGGMMHSTAPIIQPDREIVVQLTNESDSNNEASITIVYSERER